MDDQDQDMIFDYLDDLRESGVTNMFGATPYLEGMFDLSREDAQAWLKKWMRTFSERHPDVIRHSSKGRDDEQR